MMLQRKLTKKHKQDRVAHSALENDDSKQNKEVSHSMGYEKVWRG